MPVPRGWAPLLLLWPVGGLQAAADAAPLDPLQFLSTRRSPAIQNKEPNATSNMLQTVAHGDVYDIPTGRLVGEWDGFCITTAAPKAALKVGVLCLSTIELGPQLDDSIVVSGNGDRDHTNPGSLAFVDTDFGITGGTGVYNGAFGSYVTTSTSPLAYEVELTMYVPRVKEF